MMLNYKSYKAFMSDQLRTINNNSFSYSEISYFYKAYIQPVGSLSESRKGSGPGCSNVG